MKIVEEAHQFLLKRSFFQHHSNLPSVYIYILCLPLNVKMRPPVFFRWIFYVFSQIWGQSKKSKQFPINLNLGGGNSNIFYFHPSFGKIFNLTYIFQMDCFNHQPELFLERDFGETGRC